MQFIRITRATNLKIYIKIIMSMFRGGVSRNGEDDLYFYAEKDLSPSPPPPPPDFRVNNLVNEDQSEINEITKHRIINLQYPRCPQPLTRNSSIHHSNLDSTCHPHNFTRTRIHLIIPSNHSSTLRFHHHFTCNRIPNHSDHNTAFHPQHFEHHFIS